MSDLRDRIEAARAAAHAPPETPEQAAERRHREIIREMRRLPLWFLLVGTAVWLFSVIVIALYIHFSHIPTSLLPWLSAARV